VTKHRAAIALSAAALAVAVLGQTAIGQAAVGAVRVALFAQNSARVNNIQASRAPMPGRLLALNANGQFPSSVIPTPVTNSARAGGTYTRTIVVHPDPDTTKAGVELIHAIARITDNSASSPYLVKVEPGIYNLGAASLTMKPYVDLEGSGELATTVTSAVTSGYGTIIGADNSELRFLTVKNTGGGQQSVALYSETTSPRYTHVRAISSGSSENYGIHMSNGSAVLNNVTAIASGGTTVAALANFNGNAIVSNSSFTASDASGLVMGVRTTFGGSIKFSSSTLSATGGTIAMGLRSYNGNHTLANVSSSATSTGQSYGIYSGQKTSAPTVLVNQSRISGQTNSVFVLGGSVKLGASQLTGPAAVDELGMVFCAVSYTGAYGALTPGCD
jgi:hypothetical protein